MAKICVGFVVLSALSTLLIGAFVLAASFPKVTILLCAVFGLLLASKGMADIIAECGF